MLSQKWRRIPRLFLKKRIKSKKKEIPDGELAKLSVLESFDKDRLKVLIDKVIVYGSDAIEIVWKVGNPFRTETTA